MRKQLALCEEYYVEVAGERVAKLVDPVPSEIFWTSFRLVPLSSDPETTAKLFTNDFWDYRNTRSVKFRHGVSGELYPVAFPSLCPAQRLKDTGRISIRALYPESMIQTVDEKRRRRFRALRRSWLRRTVASLPRRDQRERRNAKSGVGLTGLQIRVMEMEEGRIPLWQGCIGSLFFFGIPVGVGLVIGTLLLGWGLSEFWAVMVATLLPCFGLILFIHLMSERFKRKRAERANAIFLGSLVPPEEK